MAPMEERRWVREEVGFRKREKSKKKNTLETASGGAATTTAVGRSICWRLLDLSGAPMAVACGRDHSAAVSEDGALFVWGAGTRGQLGRGSKDDRHTPARLDEVGGPVMPSCPSLVLCVHH